MDDAACRLLLELNRRFYATVAGPFDDTRQGELPGTRKLLAFLPAGRSDQPLNLVDVGCGNGRFAWTLEASGCAFDYTGVDANAQLLARAEANTRNLKNVRVRFVQADLAQPDWTDPVYRILQADGPSSGAFPRFDVVICLATLQHMPGWNLRARIVGDLAELVKPAGLVVVSAWQFLTSRRFVTRQLDWATVGLMPEQVDPGDALLPWRQKHYAVRYVHQIDEAEMAGLASDAHLAIIDSYRADGKEGNLNLYTIMRKAECPN